MGTKRIPLCGDVMRLTFCVACPTATSEAVAVDIQGLSCIAGSCLPLTHAGGELWKTTLDAEDAGALNAEGRGTGCGLPPRPRCLL